MGSYRGLVGLALLLVVAACKRSVVESREQSKRVPTTSAATSNTPAAIAAAMPANTEGAGAAGQPATLAAMGASTPSDSPPVHCAALGKRGQISIGVLHEAVISMVPERDSVFVLTYHQPLARVTLTRIRRDGALVEVKGRHTSLGEPKSPLLTAEAVYLLRNKSVIRMPRAGGEPIELARGFVGSIAVYGDYIYGFECDAKSPSDHLIRIPKNGGEIERIATVERVKANEQDGSGAVCDYQSTIADATAVYAANWNRRQVIRISISDGLVTPLSTKRAFPSSLVFDGHDILFQAAGGLYHVPKDAPNVTRISELGSAPFTFVAHAGPITYVHQSEPYVPEEWTYELVRATGKPKKIELYRALDPTDTPTDTGIRGLAVDEECLYTARQLKSGLVLYAKSLIAP